MLRQVTRGLARRGLALRTISTSALARQDDEGLPKAFSDKFVKFVPSTMAKPSFPTDFLPKEQKEVQEAPSSVPDKLTFNFYLPHEQIAKGKKVQRKHRLNSSSRDLELQCLQITLRVGVCPRLDPSACRAHHKC